MPSPHPSLPSKHERDVIQEFNECIVLLSMLGPSISSQSQRSAIETDTQEPENRWHMFLDQLSWLCDYKTAGKTVASIAVTAEPSGTVFCLASNSDSVSTASKHLKWLLGEIQNFVPNASTDREETQRRIFQRCVSFSRERVESYSESLQTLIQSSRSLKKDNHGGDVKPRCIGEFVLRNAYRSSTFSVP